VFELNRVESRVQALSFVVTGRAGWNLELAMLTQHLLTVVSQTVEPHCESCDCEMKKETKGVPSMDNQDVTETETDSSSDDDMVVGVASGSCQETRGMSDEIAQSNGLNGNDIESGKAKDDESQSQSDAERMACQTAVVCNPIEVGPLSSCESSDSSSRQCCSICMEAFHVGESVSWSADPDCGHAFHHDCISEWLLRHKECPYCRCTFLPVDREDSKGEGGGNGSNANDGGDDDENDGGRNDGVVADMLALVWYGNRTIQQQERERQRRRKRNRPKSPRSVKRLARERRLRSRTTRFCAHHGLVVIEYDGSKSKTKSKKGASSSPTSSSSSSSPKSNV